MSQEEPGVGPGREASAEPALPWEQPEFWAAVEAELAQVDPADFAHFALPVRVSPALEQALWLRLRTRLEQRSAGAAEPASRPLRG